MPKHNTHFLLRPLFAAVLLVATTQAAPPIATKTPGLPEGLLKNEWNAIYQTYLKNKFRVEPGGKPHEHIARNPSYEFGVRWDPNEFTIYPRHADWTWGLRVTEFGRPGRLEPIQPIHIANTEINYLTRRRTRGLEEWFHNTTNGLEHGFTLHAPPRGKRGPIHIGLAVHGTLALAESKSDSVTFADKETPVLSYRGLLVVDDQGRSLPARLEPRSAGKLTIIFDDTTAAYPITVDPTVQTLYTKADAPTAFDFFGQSVAISGDTVAVGALGDDTDPWMPGEPGFDVAGFNAGAVYVFVRNGSSWTQQAYLKTPEDLPNAELGISVGISGDTIVAGAHREGGPILWPPPPPGAPPTQAYAAGAAHVFVRSGATWSHQARLVASNRGEYDLFGRHVAISENIIVVGAPLEDSSATGINGFGFEDTLPDSGAAYIFRRTNTTWFLDAFVKPSQPNRLEFFGNSVAVVDDRVFVGANAENIRPTAQSNPTHFDVGAVYEFQLDGEWRQVARLRPEDPVSGSLFGSALAAERNALAVGAPGEQAVYFFDHYSGGPWRQRSRIEPPVRSPAVSFGRSVALSDSTLVVGQPDDDSGGVGVDPPPTHARAYENGAAYVYARGNRHWAHLATLKPAHALVRQHFGVSVAIDGTTFVVGSPGDNSEGSGIEPDPAPGRARSSGATYTYSTSPLVSGRTYYITEFLRGLRLSVYRGDQLLGVRGEFTDRAFQFVPEEQDDGSYRFRVLSSNRYLSVQDAPEQTVSTTTQTDDGYSRFYIDPDEHGAFRVRTQATDAVWRLGAHAGQVISTTGILGPVDGLFEFQRAEFEDIPANPLLADSIDRLFAEGVVSGCAALPLRYCPDQPTTRAQMAVMLVRGIVGSDDFPFESTPYFADVPATHPHFRWIQKLFELGITSGCGSAPARFCPARSVTRGQAAVFLIRARYGARVDFPFPPWVQFADVSSVHPFFSFIQRLFHDGITTGCSARNYCPGAAITRGQMAVLILRGLFNESRAGIRPRIRSIDGHSLAAGSTADITIRVQDLDISTAAPQFLLPPDISLNSVSILDADTLEATVTVAGDARPGYRPISITRGLETAVAPRGIVVR